MLLLVGRRRPANRGRTVNAQKAAKLPTMLRLVWPIDAVWNRKQQRVMSRTGRHSGGRTVRRSDFLISSSLSRASLSCSQVLCLATDIGVGVVSLVGSRRTTA